MGVSRRTVFTGAGAAVAGATLFPHIAGARSARGAERNRSHQPPVNPLIEQRADPQITKHTDGYYYFTATVPEYDRIILRRARTIAGLGGVEEHVIWNAHSSGIMANHIWAPELHYIEGAWYIYFAAGASWDQWRIRPYTLRNTSPNPIEGEWEEMGELNTPWDAFSLDATVFEHNGVLYHCWAQHIPGLDNNTSLVLAPMDTPWSIGAEPVEIARPTLPWERVRYAVNEGAYVLKRNGRLFLTYSGAGTGPEYSMGLLTADEDADLMDPASWYKNPEPVMVSHEGNSVFGPGHNAFTQDEYDRDVLVYHARSYEHIDGDPLNDPNRHTRVQLLEWNDDGTPHFPVPSPDGPVSPWGKQK
ncbi:glycoside hydrolase family 43 protein [Haloglycomyces albus]|uniref:glycoside hydrolase family 43 protein n=1 Tax=Haloglycomyces albus TaxID=526067 RepID=UPI00046CC78C|nr:family 43 glycosylhydrolase [Haloglycomyces albus]